MLRANKEYVAKKNDELDLREGELVTAVRIDDNMWLATSESGKSGLVPSSHVGVPPQADAGGTPGTRASIVPHDGLRPRMSIIQPGGFPGESATPPPAPPPGLLLPPPNSNPPDGPPPSFTTGSPETSPHPPPVANAFATFDESSDEDRPPPLPAPRTTTVAGAPPTMPEWMLKRGSFNADLPALPDNAAAMASLKAKLQSMTF